MALTLAFASLQAKADFIDQTSVDSWFSNINSLLTATTLAGNQSTSVDSILTLSQYTGSADLTRVQIILEQPYGYSPTVTADVSIASGSGSVIFGASGNSIRETTTVAAGDSSIEGALNTAGTGLNSYISTKSSAYNNTSLNNTDVITRSVSINSTFTLFDSNLAGISLVDLNNIFKGAGNMTFGFSTQEVFAFSRNNTLGLQAAFNGVNSGKITAIYTVPEPSTYALLAAGLTCIVILRKRRTV